MVLKQAVYVCSETWNITYCCKKEGKVTGLKHDFFYRITCLATSPYCTAPVSCQRTGDPMEIRCSISSAGVTSSAVLCSANEPRLFNCLQACGAGLCERLGHGLPRSVCLGRGSCPPCPGRRNIVLSCVHPAAGTLVASNCINSAASICGTRYSGEKEEQGGQSLHVPSEALK